MKELNKKREIMGRARRGTFITDFGLASDAAAFGDDYGGAYSSYSSTEDEMRLY